jgi:hypothetical protein
LVDETFGTGMESRRDRRGIILKVRTMKMVEVIEKKQ